jgi:hypothetical protein
MDEPVMSRSIRDRRDASHRAIARALRGSSYEYSNRFSTAKTAAAARVETPILS